MSNIGNGDWSVGASTPVLRVEFSELVDVDTLTLLHSEGLSDKLPADFCRLMESAQVEQLIEVYRLSHQEIVDDRYGFARDFKCTLRTHTDWNSSLSILRQSPLVRRARPLTVRGGCG